MGGMTVTNVTSRVLMLGDNHFCSAKITLAANAALAAGAMLKRGPDSISFDAAGPADDYAAVNPFEITNTTGAAKVFGFRALMDGRVREDMLRVGANPVSAADIDKLRKAGILPVKVADLSHPDNQ